MMPMVLQRGPSGTRFAAGWPLPPPDLIIQDELHLISRPARNDVRTV